MNEEERLNPSLRVLILGCGKQSLSTNEEVQFMNV